MRKFSIKTAVSAIFTAAALLGTTCFATGAATSTDSAAADDEVIIKYSSQKTDDYLKFSSDNITNSGTLTAKHLTQAQTKATQFSLRTPAYFHIATITTRTRTMNL